MGGRIRQATIGNIRELLQGERPVVVDFWANWCGPCHVMTPILRDMSEKFEDQIIFAKVDVQRSGDLAEQFGVTTIPTLILFRNGKEWDRLSGIRNRTQLSKIFGKLISA